MSLYSFYSSKKFASAAEIEKSLDGNLCRCTGYRSILEAANKAKPLEIDYGCGIDEKCKKPLVDLEDLAIYKRTDLKEIFSFRNSRCVRFHPKSISQLLHLKVKKSLKTSRSIQQPSLSAATPKSALKPNSKIIFIRL